jgi:hypothetical protein
MIPARTMAAVSGLTLLAAILWAFSAAPFWPSLAHVTANPWGIVTLVDLYVGFILFGLLIAAVEKRVLVPLGLTLLACLLGNLVFAAWLVWRLPALLARQGGLIS